MRLDKYRAALLFVVFLNAFVLTRLMFHPYQEFFTYPYFMNSGLIPYKQILDQHFPGIMFLPVNLSTLGMNDEYSARVWLIGVVSITHVLIYFIGREIFSSKKKALLANMLYLAWQPFFEGWAFWIDTFLPLMLLPAFYFTYKSVFHKAKKYLVLSGVLLGVGILFKQVVIPLAGLVFLIILLSRKNIKDTLYFLAGLVPIPVLMCFYFYLLGVFSDFWYWTVTYNLTVFSKYGRKVGETSALLRVAAVYGFSVISVFATKQRKLLVLLFVFLFGSLLSAYARHDFVHLQPSLPFLCFLSVISISVLWKNNFGKALIVLYIAGSAFLLVNFYEGHVSDKVFFFDQETKNIAQKIKDYTNAKEKIFIYGSIPSLYYMSNTLPSGNLYIQQYSWFFVVSEDQILRSIVNDAPNLVVADRTVHVDGQDLVNYSPKIDEYILHNYSLVEKIGTTEFMLKK